MNAVAILNSADSVVSDDAVLLAVAAGDRNAMNEFAIRFRSVLFAFFFRKTRDAGRADDLCQNALIKAIRNAGHYRDNRDRYENGNVKGWVYRIARNALVDDARKEAREVSVKALRETDSGVAFVALAADAGPQDHVAVDHRDDIARVMGHLESLPADQRDAFIAHRVNGETLLSIAERWGLSRTTVQSRCRLATEKLTEMLARDGAFAAVA